MAIDSHMHANGLVVKNLSSVITSINNDNTLKAVINVGLNIATSRGSIEIARNNQKFYSAIGIHPLYIKGETPRHLYSFASEDKVIAIGEIGIDKIAPNLNEQIQYLTQQIEIANELELPVIIHANNANHLVIEIFEKLVKPRYGCVFHCFQPDFEALDYIVLNKFYISFASRITYPTADKSLKIAIKVPEDLFLVETDSPYLPPEPFKGQENKSSNIKYIIQRIAQIKKKSYQEIEALTTENALRLFKKIK